MKLIKLVLLLTMLVGFSTYAMSDRHRDRPKSSTSSNMVGAQEVLDRNFNPYFAMKDYYNRIKWSGMIQAMAGISNFDSEFSRFGSKKTVSDIVLPVAEIYMDAIISDWASAHLAFSFNNARATQEQQNFNGNLAFNVQNAIVAQKLQDAGTPWGSTGTSGVFARDDANSYRRYRLIDEAVITLGDFNRYPVFFRAGLGRIPFGNYERHVYPVPLVTILTETQVIYAQTGFVDDRGINGSVYVFTGSRKNIYDRPAFNIKSDQVNINNFGASVGYCTGGSNWGVDFVLDYLYNMAGAINALHGDTWREYDRVVGGLHGGIKGWYHGFDGNIAYVTAVRKFGKDDTLISFDERPSALHIEGGYSFPICEMNTRFSVSYQMSFNARLIHSAISGSVGVPEPGYISEADVSSFAIPEYRVHGNYTVDVCKNLTVGAHAVWNKPYKPLRVNSWTGLLSLTARIA